MAQENRKKQLQNWKSILQCLHKLLGETSNVIGFETQKNNLIDVLKRTINFGEGNSLIINGAKGSGKTSLLKTALKDIFEDCRLKSNVLQVNLNGLLQTDDRIAIKEITFQLQLENACEHRVFRSFSENLHFLLDSLKTGDRQTKAVIFILEEMDLFCHHHNQTLLYNLFDVSQSSQTPVAVIGLTRRLDVVELLEKRVKSRFSHRQILLMTNTTLEQYLQIAQQFLTLPENSVHRGTFIEWNKNIKVLFSGKKVQEILRQLYGIANDIGSLKSFLARPIYHLTNGDIVLTEKHFVSAWEHFTQDSKLQLLGGVSVLELCLLLCMRRLVEIYDGVPFNFEMIYKEYLKFAATKSTYNFDKQVVLKSFENLVKMELALPVESTRSKVQIGYQMMSLLVDPDQILAAVKLYPNLPTEVLQWSSTLVA